MPHSLELHAALHTALAAVCLAAGLFVGAVGWLIDCAVPKPTTRVGRIRRWLARRALHLVVALGLALALAEILQMLQALQILAR